MKKMMIALMAVLITVALAGIGTYAWFSDTETSTGNTFTAGTLNMQIADINEGWNNGTPVTASWKSPSNWAPGDTFTTDRIRLNNVGSIDIKYLFTAYTDYSYAGGTGGANLGNVIEVLEYWEYIPGYGWIDNMQPPQDEELLVGDNAAPLTLRELVDAAWSGDTTPWVDYCTGSGYDTTPGPAIIVGGTYETYLVLKFMPTAGNEYQGASCQFNIGFEGVQDNVAQKH